ncbi:MAG TPA: hypothetical protein VF729_01885 [Solirubrobacterales bacterium]
MRRSALALLTIGLALTPSPAAAEFHLVSVREVFPGDSSAPEAEYVELQAYAAGQNFIAGHPVTFHNAGGATIGTETFDKDVADGRNQMTIVMGTAAAESRFGILADETMAPGLLAPGGGAVCWATLDCVAWGNFSGSLPSAAGTPAASPAGIPDGMALRRTIAPGCPTLLEAGDDRNDSALDFAPVFPSPRPNAVAPSETACETAAGGQPGAGGQRGDKSGAPQTLLRSRPRQRTRDRTPTFRFGSPDQGVAFECKLDRRPFRACRSPFTARRLPYGPHSFRVRARDATGQPDPTPALDTFRVVRRLG